MKWSFVHQRPVSTCALDLFPSCQDWLLWSSLSPTSSMCHHPLAMGLFLPLVSHLLPATVLLQLSLLQLIFMKILMHRLFPCYLSSSSADQWGDCLYKSSEFLWSRAQKISMWPSFFSTSQLHWTQPTLSYTLNILRASPLWTFVLISITSSFFLPTSNFRFLWGQYGAYTPFFLSSLTRSSLWQLQILPQW